MKTTMKAMGQLLVFSLLLAATAGAHAAGTYTLTCDRGQERNIHALR